MPYQKHNGGVGEHTGAIQPSDAPPEWNVTTAFPPSQSSASSAPAPEHLDTQAPPPPLPSKPATKPARPERKPAATFLEVGEMVRHYEIIRELGRGGMGVVYLARDVKLGRKVAIKVLMKCSPAVQTRFLREARTTAQCTHPNIVTIHEVGEHRDYPYMVLEYLEGTNLRALIRKGPIPIPRVVTLALPIVRALSRAHAMGIVHRDLKPENVMLTDDGVVKVLDFGIAKLLNATPAAIPDLARVDVGTQAYQTKRGMIIGTLPYMAPEQLSTDVVTDRTDLWALGMMLIEMALGRHPLAPMSPAKMLEVTTLSSPMPPAHSHVPRIGKLGAVIDRCLVKDMRQRMPDASTLLTELEALAPTRRPHNEEDRPPFPGLAVFQETDADRFFGRDKEVAHVVARLQHIPLVTLVGPSGMGKSSLVRAGVIPALKASGETWEAEIIRPGRRPLVALASLLSKVTDQMSTLRSDPEVDLEMDQDALVQQLRQEPGYLGKRLRQWAHRLGGRVVLFVDQFEELYTLTEDPEARAQFVACLAGVADDATSALRVVLAMRADFLDRVVEDRRFMADVNEGLVLLPPVTSEGLQAALEQPVQAAGYRFEDEALVHRMLKDLEGTPNALPLLQFCASQLWELRDQTDHVLTHESYRTIGGIAGTLASHADAVLSSLPPAQKPLVRAIFQRLVTPERTRDLASMKELCSLPGEALELRQVVNALTRARLLSIEPGATQTEAIVEIVHESLIDGWPTLRQWLDEDQDDAEFLARLRAAAQQWERSEYRPGLLWRDEAAQEAAQWVQRSTKPLADREQHYLDAVLQLKQGSQRHRRLWIRGALSVLLAFSIVMASLALWAVESRDRARLAQGKAVTAAAQSRQAEAKAKEAAVQSRQAEAKAKKAAEQERLSRQISDQARQELAEAIKSERSAKQAAQQAARMAERERRLAEAAAERERQARQEATKSAAEVRRLFEQATELAAQKEKARTDLLEEKIDGQLLLEMTSWPPADLFTEER